MQKQEEKKQPSQELVERVARAICRAGICGPKEHLDEQENLYWRKFELEAKAVISCIPISQNEGLVKAAQKIIKIVSDRINKGTNNYIDWIWDLDGAVYELEQALSQQPVSGGWQPIDTIPIDEECLIFGTRHNMLYEKNQILIGYKNIRNSFWSISGETISHSTHWQPLPLPPTGDKNGSENGM